jgi:flagellar motor switch protein FliM
MREPWENVTQIKPRLEKIETNAQFAQIISPNEMIALVTLSAKISDVEGMINLCIPYPVLESIIPKLSTKFWFSMREKVMTDEGKKTLEKKIEFTKVPIKAILGNSTLTFADMAELQPGDVIQLDTRINEDLKVFVGDIYKFKARPGVKKNRMAIKVTGVIREEEENG